jgi:hypothetical protein
VEWEDDLVFYSDGTTNQQQFMRALGILLGRWLLGWGPSDLSAAFFGSGAQEFLPGLIGVLTPLLERVYQLVGLYQGLWEAGTEVIGGRIFPRAARTTAADSTEESVKSAIARFLTSIRLVTEPFKGG